MILFPASLQTAGMAKPRGCSWWPQNLGSPTGPWQSSGEGPLSCPQSRAGAAWLGHSRRINLAIPCSPPLHPAMETMLNISFEQEVFEMAKNPVLIKAWLLSCCQAFARGKREILKPQDQSGAGSYFSCTECPALLIKGLATVVLKVTLTFKELLKALACNKRPDTQSQSNSNASLMIMKQPFVLKLKEEPQTYL